ncbi:MAG: ABC transporter permease [Alphaproteobacteria bacterium]|nr:ABC transporter permease [Alphaproteobacteria bacterium]
MDFLVFWLSNIPSFAAPFALGVLGMIICERSGVLNLGAEGFVLVGAMSGAGLLIGYGDFPLLALVVSGACAALLGVLFGLLVATLRVNQVIAGLIIVFLAQGLTSLISRNMGWVNKPFSGLGKLDFGLLSDIPTIGPILFGQDLVVYLTVLIYFISFQIINKTNLGLMLRAVGESPEAVDAAGGNVTLLRFGAIVVGAFFLGVAGGYLTVVVSKIWVDGISGGRGWIIIALVIFARWRLWRAMVGAVLFGCIEALIPRLAAIGVQLPQYFVLMLPYVVTLLVMVWSNVQSGGREGAPSALGRPYLREERH